MSSLLAAILALVYAATAFHAGVWWDIPAGELLDLGASHGPAIASGESWRLLSALFLHGGLLHLLFNSVALLQIGRPIEHRLGPAALATTLLLSGAVGFLASLFWQPEGISVGASGGIFGLLGVWLVSAWQDAVIRYPSPIRFRAAIVLTVVAALALGLAVPGVDHAAHLGGLATGVILGSVFSGKWHWPEFFASALALAAILLLVPPVLPDAWRAEFVEARRYTETYRNFAREDRAINEALQALGEASRRGALSDSAGLARIDDELLPRLALAAERWRKSEWHSPHLAGEAARWMRYTELRLGGVTAMRNAIAASDPATATRELERFERLMTEAAHLAHDTDTKTATPADGR